MNIGKSHGEWKSGGQMKTDAWEVRWEGHPFRGFWDSRESSLFLWDVSWGGRSAGWFLCLSELAGLHPSLTEHWLNRTIESLLKTTDQWGTEHSDATKASPQSLCESWKEEGSLQWMCWTIFRTAVTTVALQHSRSLVLGSWLQSSTHESEGLRFKSPSTQASPSPREYSEMPIPATTKFWGCSSVVEYLPGWLKQWLILAWQRKNKKQTKNQNHYLLTHRNIKHPHNIKWPRLRMICSIRIYSSLYTWPLRRLKWEYLSPGVWV